MINEITNQGRKLLVPVAKFIDKASGGRIGPNFITLLSLLGHIFVLMALIGNNLVLAAILIVVFGLMDALDGSLATIQGKNSPTGMLYDASSDRAKEIIIYLGITYYFADAENMAGVIMSMLALGGSFMVSYIKAKGETAIAASAGSHQKANRQFTDGLMQYQVRMLILVVGLASSYITVAITVIAVLSWFTALGRLIDISEQLKLK